MTQPGEPPFSWNNLIGALTGCGIVVACFIALRYHNKRRREARKERAPQPTKVLRPAGHTCLCRAEEHAEKFESAMLEALLTGALFGFCCSGIYPVAAAWALGRITSAQLVEASKTSMLVALGLLTAIVLLWSIRSFLLAAEQQDKMSRWRFGARGEQAVAEKLADQALAAAGYVAYHDLPGNGKWNVDHVVVGPGGVFVLETKARSRRRATKDQEEHEVRYDGRTLQFPWCDDHKAAAQAERNARWVRELIADFAPKDVLIQPVIVVPGWYVKTLGDFPVKAMNGTYLVSYITGQKRRFTAEQLRPVIRRIDERCRDLEF